ncbi:hypothetical protein JAAARDRAFT_616278 [Jaapia argillacea MUCL 33604]|uniref:Uncharacterized protein n=1 Tax=Jaapia argillacea MUCL 33604 TaxID=933084 RepID=A0A067P786_9AGAM|nr:hypothetical protein JAAARDRAFT_616278 [Jaapia argillacea MUCL 33604]
MEAAYSGSGPPYVDVATELALLSADSNHSLIQDWLRKHMEHQDNGLNREVYNLGASDDDLHLLYRLSYATMLVSLSSHSKACQLRPEMSVFVAYWRHTKPTEPLPTWTSSEEVRIRSEEAGIDPRADLQGLIAAVLGLPTTR